jgi:hypothetical protein
MGDAGTAEGEPLFTGCWASDGEAIPVMRTFWSPSWRRHHAPGPFPRDGYSPVDLRHQSLGVVVDQLLVRRILAVCWVPMTT